MKKQIVNTLLAAIVLATASCYKDKSQTELLPLPNITVIPDDFMSRGRVVYTNEETELFVPVLWNGEDSTRYDYRWTHMGKEISTERTLRHIFTETGATSVSFQVVQRSTGIAFGTTLSISISTKFLVGWLILSEKEGRSALDFIHIDTEELYPDIHHEFYPDDPLGSQPYRLEQHFTAAYDEILVMQRGGPGLVELDGRDFSKVITTREEFVGEKYPYEGFNPVQVCYANTTVSGVELLLTDKGEVYSRLNRTGNSSFQTAQYPSVPLVYPDGKGMSITRTTFPKLTFLPMYDALNRRWLSMYLSYSNDKLLPPWVKRYDEADAPGFYNFCSGMPPNIELLYAQTCDEWSNRGFLVNILKDTDTGKLYFQKSTITYNPGEYIEVSEPEQYEFAEGLGINADTRFWMLRGQNTAFQDSPHLFFNVGNKVYCHRQEIKKTFLYKDFGTVTDAPAGKIVSIHTNAVVTKLGVAFDDGHFFICDIDPDTITAIARGDIPADDPALVQRHYTGLGKIVHSIFKYGRFANWSSAEDDYR
ncbi:MAG: hypothetical protein LBP56_06890 [Odoribacteraceae bacterium]|jgi:hypothetical protein|nr:hypothetical protein [Odoribacteraceae bacterium]